RSRRAKTSPVKFQPDKSAAELARTALLRSRVHLVSQIGFEDHDLLPHWLAHYHALGVTDVHLVLNGSSPNRRLLRKACRGYAVTIAEEHDQPDSDEARREALARLVRGFAGEWVLLADADEFVELPFLSLPATLRALRAFGMTALPAISVQ